MDRDDEADARDDRDLADWEPLFGPHTPADEVAELADRYADRAVSGIRAHLAALPLTPDAREAVEPQLVDGIMKMYMRDVFARIHRRLKTGTDGT